MTINCKYTTDNELKVNKTAVSIRDNIPIDPLSIINQLNPVFVINYDASLLSCNYVECSALGRKYNALISVDTAGRIVLTCSVDYLSSFDLQNCDITVSRSESAGAPTYIPDSKLPIKPNVKDLTSIPVSATGLDVNAVYPYLLTVIGGDD